MRSLRDVILAGTFATLLVQVALAQQADEHQIEIAAGTVSHSIQELIRQTGVQLSVDPHAIDGVSSQAVSGQLTLADALSILLEDTGLSFEFVNERTVAIFARAATDSPSQHTTLVPGAGQDTRAARGGDRARDASARGRILQSLEEVIVLGTFIRGIEPVGSQVIRLGRREIERTGYATLRDVVRALPQNFGGGPSEDTTLGDEAAANTGRATGLNLRGLGSAATLVLLDGRRMAPSGSKGTFIDVSMIPLIAVEEVTLLPDGASAAYGSDAVGGVVNLGLRDHFAGRETWMRFGSVTSGGQREHQFSQLVGTQWNSGSGLFAFDYYDRDALAGADRAQMVSDLRPFGGDNFDTQHGNPGTIIIGSRTWAIPSGQDGRSLMPADLLPDTANLSNRQAGRDVFADEELLSVLATVRHQLTEDLNLFADVLISRREVRANGGGLVVVLPVPGTNPFYVNPLGGSTPIAVAYDFASDLGMTTHDGDIRAANSAIGATLDMRASWQLAAQAGHSMTREHGLTRGLVDRGSLALALADPSHETAFNPFGDGSNSSPSTIAAIRAETRLTTGSALRGMSLIADGPLMRLAGGEVKIAIGAEYRLESFESALKSLSRSDPDGALSTAEATLARDYRGAFAELVIPVVGPENRRSAFESLQLSLAGRVDSYERFGRAFTPKLGIAWSPTKDLSVRGTWSEAFRAPSLAQLDESSNRSAIVRLPDLLSPTGASSTLLWVGENANLKEETAVVWTAGADFESTKVPGFRIGATYFDFEFDDRLQGVAATPDMLRDPRFADIVYRDPTASQREHVCARSVFIGNGADCLGASIDAIVDARTNNTASVRTSGIDLLASYTRTNALGTFDFAVNSSRLIQYARAERRTSPLADVLDTEGDPLDLRLRASLSWENGFFTASGSINHADGYKDTLSQPNRPVESWTTFDARLAVTPWDEGFLAGTEIVAAAQNVFDEPPPFLNNPAGVGYDPENADLLGRFVSLQVRKDW